MIWIVSIAMGAGAVLWGLGLLAAVVSCFRSAKPVRAPVGLGRGGDSISLAYAALAILFVVGFGIAYFRLR